MEDISEVVADLCGTAPVRWTPVGGGYTRANRWLVHFDDGTSAFVKAASGAESVAIQREAQVLTQLNGTFCPAVVGTAIDPGRAVLVMESLADWRWPPPYPPSVGILFDMLAEVRAHPAPAGLERLGAVEPLWDRIAADPASFPAVRVVASEWLQEAAGPLAAAESTFDPSGDALVHNDVWAGNIAMSMERAVLVDWSEAKIGSPAVDLGFLHLSLRSEGGPTPNSFSGDEEFVGWWSARLVETLSSGPPEGLHPDIVVGLEKDLSAAFTWTAELFDLPRPVFPRPDR